MQPSEEGRFGRHETAGPPPFAHAEIAAFEIIVRALAQGWRVGVVQFLKSATKSFRAPASLREVADMATEMVKVRHPFDSGIYARAGIDY